MNSSLVLPYSSCEKPIYLDPFLDFKIRDAKLFWTVVSPTNFGSDKPSEGLGYVCNFVINTQLLSEQLLLSWDKATPSPHFGDCSSMCYDRNASVLSVATSLFFLIVYSCQEYLPFFFFFSFYTHETEFSITLSFKSAFFRAWRRFVLNPRCSSLG